MTATLPTVCPVCGAPGLEVRPPHGRAAELRRCPRCEAELRRTGPDLWTLEYLHPDWLPGVLPGKPTDPKSLGRLVLLQSHSWEDWKATFVGAFPLPVGPSQSPHEPLPPGETVTATFSPVRIVLATTHHMGNTSGPAGTLWVTPHLLHLEAGTFVWRIPLTEVRRATDVGRMLELVWGRTDEPLHLLMEDSSRAATSIMDARSKLPSPPSR